MKDRFVPSTTKTLIGRKIVGVELNPFSDGRTPRSIAHSPVLVLDDGRRLYFITTETEIGEYGINMFATKKPRKSK